MQIVGFTRWLGWGSLAAVLALVGNAIVLSVQDRVKEHAVLQTLGFKPSMIGQLVVTEGLIVGILGGRAADYYGQQRTFAVARRGSSQVMSGGLARVFLDEYLPEVVRQTPLTSRGRFDRA